MRQHPEEWTGHTKYILIYPRANVSFAEVAARYAALLRPGGDSFSHLTIEDVLDAAFAHGGPTKERFRQRYLW